MSEFHPQSSAEAVGAPFGWSFDFLSQRLAQLDEQQQDWEAGVVVDAGAVQREMTCNDISPRQPGLLVDTSSRTSMFHRLVGELFMAGVRAGVFPGEVRAAEVELLAEVGDVSPEAFFFLQIERSLTGEKLMNRVLTKALTNLSRGLEFFLAADEARLQSLSWPRASSWSLRSSEVGLLRRRTEEAGKFVVPRDGLVFTQNSRDIRLGSRDDFFRLKRTLMEADVLVAVARHFMETRVPAESIIVVDIATGDSEERILNPTSFMKSLDAVAHAFESGTRRALGFGVPRRGGSWCTACEAERYCPYSKSPRFQQMNEQEEDEL